MVDTRRPGWRWSNVPVPEEHVAGLLLGLALHLLAPRPAVGNRRHAAVVGVGLLGGGLLLVGWAVVAVGRRDAGGPAGLVTGGPYAWSRNPMYVAWTGIYAGVALLANAAWLWLLVPLVVASTHRTVRREERALERAFGEEYRDYRRDVRRYV